MGWIGGVVGGSVAATAAAAKRRREQQEEERMTQYTLEELSDGWEFKIVRAGLPVFGKRERLRQLVEDEARAGWVLLEKLDDQRVRFKRPRSAREQDEWLPADVDPYRSHYGSLAGSQAARMSMVLVGVLLLGVFALVAVLLGSGGGSVIMPMLIAGLVFVLLLAGLAVGFVRR